jgi:YesN/AraC family two-component response regulator
MLMTLNNESPKRKMRMLIADDVQETRRNTRLMLSTILDAEVVAIATNGLQAVQLAKEHHPDIVIMDINMPEMDGLTAAKEIINYSPDTGCIIMSSERDTTTLRNAMSIGAQEYLIKPFTVDELEQAVNRVSERVARYRQRAVQTDELHQRSELYLKQLAEEYTRTRRTDVQSLDVFEQLAANPQCEIRWLRTLAMLYVIRQDWGKLNTLAARLEMQTRKQNK